ncbi:MAG: nucleotidyltransferase domain-containing protein [Candidatus Symbiothrix sp.]|jgi:predicted nucleotidyltransferase|nr:nucleotidyltransferase domain-containing protein [Candidatus Symbiothrix sp.]
MKRTEITDALKLALHRVAPDATTILYGSEARGDARPNSDIDLLILVDKDRITLKEQQDITFPLYDVEVEKGVLINPLVISRKQWETKYRITPFYQNVMREGLVL